MAALKRLALSTILPAFGFLLIFLMTSGSAWANFTATYSGQLFAPANCDSQVYQCISGSLQLQIEFVGDLTSELSTTDSSQIISISETVNGQTFTYPPNPVAFAMSFSNGHVSAWAIAINITTPCGGSFYASSNSTGSDLFEEVSCSGSPILYGQSSGPGTWSVTPGTDRSLGDCGCHVGDAPVGEPISVGTGNLYERVTDYTTAGPNALALTRSYNSIPASQSNAVSLGRNWHSNFERYLTVYNGAASQTVTAERPDGRIITFTGFAGYLSGDTDIDVTLTVSGSNWILKDHDDTVETYASNSAGALQLTAITKRGGYRQRLSYNSSGQVESVVDTYGRKITFSYTGTLLTAVTTPDKTTITYGYTESGVNGTSLDRLARVDYSTTPATGQAYVYENTTYPFALTGIIDEDGNRFTTWTYDGQGRATSSQHAGGADLTQLTYNADGSTTVLNALGEQEVYKFTTLQGSPKITEIDRLPTATTAAAVRLLTYDANGYLATSSDWNSNVTQYINDYRGLPLVVVEAANTSISRETQTTWSAKFHVPTKIVTVGLTQNFAYDAEGNQISRTDVATGATRAWTYGWTNAELTSIIGPRADLLQTTVFTYSSLGRLASIKNALGQIISIPSSTIGGRPEKIIDPNGVTSSLTYDPRQRLIASAVTTAAGMRVTHFTYDAAGNLTKTILPDGSFLANTYDPAHRLIATVDPLGNMVAYTLDAMGDRSATIVGKAGTATWQDAVIFDALGRNIVDVLGAGEKTRTTYDPNGQLLTRTDSLSHTTGQALDALGRVSISFDAAKAKTTFAYDQHDRITKVIGPNLSTTTYTYDGLGRMLKRISPDTGTTTYTYDLADNLIQCVDASGVITTHTYDALNRLLSTSYPADPSENVVITYDQSGHGFGIGHLTSLSDAAGTMSFSYDERGNELSESRASGSIIFSTGYTYDAASRLATIAYPSGAVAYYAHDKSGRVSGVKLQTPGATTTGVIAADVSYAPFGPLAGMTYGNGLHEDRVYDQSYRLKKLSSGGVRSLNYTYDLADNVKAIADNIQTGNSQTFGYDTVYHLNAAAGAYGKFSWTYDAAGNRLTETTQDGTLTQYAYQAGSNVLANVTSDGIAAQVTTSPAGNIIALTSPSSATDLMFNKGERLASVEIGTSQVATYTYDAFGRRFSKAVGNGGSIFQYSISDALLEETDGAGHLKTDTIYLNGVPVADVTSNAIFFLHTDRLGTPQLATTTMKAVVWQAAYQPFGINTGTTGLLAQNLRFPGQYADSETGWYQNRFRDYNAGMGRYLESDPIGLKGGVNTYQYANQNPLAWADPSGEEYVGGMDFGGMNSSAYLSFPMSPSFEFLRLPDYVSGSINIAIPTPWTATLLGWSGTASIDRYGDTFFSPFGAGAGKSLTAISASATVNWLDQSTTPCPSQLKDFLSGNGYNITAGYYGGVSQSYTPGGGFATGFGFVTPQIGGSYNYSFAGGNVGLKW